MSSRVSPIPSILRNSAETKNPAVQGPGYAPQGGANQMSVAMLKIDNLEAWLKRGASSVFTETVAVTPDLARRLLDRNNDNRPLRLKGAARTVEAYANAMLRGEWKLNGEPVIVSRDGLLNDGQHRLMAVMESGVVVPMQIAFGVDRETRHTVDQGGARTPGDILSMHGEKSAHVLAHELQFLWAYAGQKGFNYRPSPEQLLATLAENPDARDAIAKVRPLSSEFRLSMGYLAGSYLICSRLSQMTADALVQVATTGLNITEHGSPAYRLRSLYNQHYANKLHLPAVEQAALFIKAFNLMLHKRNTRNLAWRRYGERAESFPEVGVVPRKRDDAE